MRGAKAIPIIRVVWNDINAIKRALDTGAYGVVVPWVSSRKEAVDAVRFCRYPPEGIRGAAPGRPSKVWGMSKEEYLWSANEEIIIIVQIEREEAVNNIEEILSVEGIDATFIGPTDLSNSLGFKGEPFHPEVVKAIEKVLDACKDAGVAPGIAYTQNHEHTKELIEKGFQLIGIGSDVGFLQKGCEAAIEAIKQGKN
jgi:2-dehydro-3-deoxyglucarate aldolase/4-hydroxy-2-oxoheptanedioate aldolase